MEDLRDMDRDVEQEAFERSPGLRFLQVRWLCITGTLRSLRSPRLLLYRRL